MQSAGPGGLAICVLAFTGIRFGEPSDLVFASPTGSPLGLGKWRHGVFDPARATAGITGLTVQRMLGHSLAAMTLDVYAGLFGDDLDSVAALLDSHVPQMRSIAEIEAPKGGHDDAA